MRILIFLLALISAFFVSSNEPDLTSLRSPQLKVFYTIQCGANGSIVGQVVSESKDPIDCRPFY